jgi:hypothetical protein
MIIFLGVNFLPFATNKNPGQLIQRIWVKNLAKVARF